MPGAMCRQVIRSHGIDYDNFKTLSIKKKINLFWKVGTEKPKTAISGLNTWTLKQSVINRDYIFHEWIP